MICQEPAKGQDQAVEVGTEPVCPVAAKHPAPRATGAARAGVRDGRESVLWRKRRRHRATPVVLPEGLSAGGGVRFTSVDPGVPLGPGLLATCPVFHGPDARIASASKKATTIAARVVPLIELSRSWRSSMVSLRVMITTPHRRGDNLDP